jgi:hypothetical protein
VIFSQAWSSAYPGACFGILRVAGVRNPDSDPAICFAPLNAAHRKGPPLAPDAASAGPAPYAWPPVAPSPGAGWLGLRSW